MNAIFDEIGIPLCKGNVMAGNPAWNGDSAAWRARLAGWTETIDPADLLAVDIFFDFRFVDGDAALAAELRDQSLEIARTSRPLVKLLAEQLSGWSPPLGFLGRITAVDGRVDLKKGGLFPIVAAARCLALSHGIPARSTAERLAGLRERGIGSAEDIAMLESCHAAFSGLILRQQIRDIDRGLPPSTLVEIGALPRQEHAELKTSLAALKTVPDLVRDLLFPV
jgi:DNA polymerase-3 subunit epsilon/CBS domain-containing protein